MKLGRITAGGQLSIPAAIRRRWGTKLVALDDQGNQLVIKPLPADAITAARGALAGRIGDASELRRAARRDDDAAVSRRH